MNTSTHLGLVATLTTRSMVRRNLTTTRRCVLLCGFVEAAKRSKIASTAYRLTFHVESIGLIDRRKPGGTDVGLYEAPMRPKNSKPA